MRPALDLDQIGYLKTVLGLDRVLLPTPHEQPVPQEAGSARLIVLLPLKAEEFPLRGESQILIEKMIRAMKLDSGDVMLVSWNLESGASDAVASVPEQANGRPILIFGHGDDAAFTGSEA